jgi:hypothetical protein
MLNDLANILQFFNYMQNIEQKEDLNKITEKLDKILDILIKEREK